MPMAQVHYSTKLDEEIKEDLARICFWDGPDQTVVLDQLLRPWVQEKIKANGGRYPGIPRDDGITPEPGIHKGVPKAPEARPVNPRRHGRRSRKEG